MLGGETERDRAVERSSRSHRAARTKRFPYYQALLYVGLVTALVVADRLARRSGIDPTRLVAAFLISIPVCLAGARALAVGLNWSHFRARPREILALSKGGAAMYGALPPLLLVSIPLSRWLGIPFGMFWDAALVSILAGMIPTRFGCLGAGCCAGRRTASWLGLLLRNAHGVRAHRYPSPLFEALLGAALLAASLLLWGRFPFSGALAFLICAGYGVGRFALEELREERPTRFAGLGTFQWMSAALFVLGIGGLAVGWAGPHVPAPPEVALAADAQGVLRLFVSGLLLLPILHLFRFLGCDRVFGVDPHFPPVQNLHLLHMLVSVPDLGAGPATVLMRFLREPEMDEIDDSPVGLLGAGMEPDGRLRFEALEELPEASYTVTCTVERPGAETRAGTCSGTLNAADLFLQFNAAIGSEPTDLQARFCFEPLLP